MRNSHNLQPYIGSFSNYDVTDLAWKLTKLDLFNFFLAHKQIEKPRDPNENFPVIYQNFVRLDSYMSNQMAHEKADKSDKKDQFLSFLSKKIAEKISDCTQFENKIFSKFLKSAFYFSREQIKYLDGKDFKKFITLVCFEIRSRQGWRNCILRVPINTLAEKMQWKEILTFWLCPDIEQKVFGLWLKLFGSVVSCRCVSRSNDGGGVDDPMC